MKGHASVKRQLIAGAALLALLTIPALGGDAQDSLSLGAPQSELRGMIERFSSDMGSLRRTYSLDCSPSDRARLRKFFQEWRTELDRVPFDALSRDGKIDDVLFTNYLTHSLHQLEHDSASSEEQSPLLPFAGTIIDLHERQRQMQSVDPAAAAATLNGLRKEVLALLKSIDPATVKPTVAHRAETTVGELRSALKDWFVFHNGYEPLFTWWAAAPYEAVDSALKAYALFLREKVVGVAGSDRDAIVGDPIGRKALLDELAFEMIPYAPEELVAIANQEFAWCETEMKRASSDLGYGGDWKKALEHVKTLHVEPGKQPELVRDLALEAVRFVEDRELVTIPPLAKESWRMEMMSPERQKVNPFFLGGEVISVSYPTNTMSHEEKMMSMRGNNIHFSRATVFHELIPGHHLQGFMMERYKPYRSLFATPFWVEGNSLYWEMLFWDLGFAKSPENRIGMLFWRMHRCARIIFSLSFHLGKMTPAQCVDYLVDRVGHERENATAEVRRSLSGDYGPLYQCAYMLGALQFRALRRELVDSGTMTNREFHDSILRENAIPVEMLRAKLTGQELPKAFSTRWKFYTFDRMK
jgi:uncharacterized protein (DUF885 family)